MSSAFRSVSRSALLTVAASLVVAASAFAADPGRIVVQVDKPGARINPLLFGLMTEEINFSYDGGLYGELIQNRIFRNTRATRGSAVEFADAKPIEGVPHWYIVTSPDAVGTAVPDANDPVNTTALTTSLKLMISGVPARGRVGVAHTGVWGNPAK
ncbi:MAG: hypothetical protein ABFE01_13420, partial [Phycisphaerales bacterium]